MSTGHYAEAERLLRLADERISEDWRTMTGEAKSDVLAAAQVHATLATVQRGMSVGTLSVDLAPADSPGYLSIPWPPSDELVETVASMLEATDGGDYNAIARAVLDAIGGDR